MIKGVEYTQQVTLCNGRMRGSILKNFGWFMWWRQHEKICYLYVSSGKRELKCELPICDEALLSDLN